MTPYRDSLAYSPKVWSQAPEGATHWGMAQVMLNGQNELSGEPVGQWLKETHPWRQGETYESSLHFESYWTSYSSFGLAPSEVTDLHERPQCYQSPAQLIEAYRKDHGAEIEADVDSFIAGTLDEGDVLPVLDTLLDDVLFHLVLLERHLAAERARIEGVEK